MDKTQALTVAKDVNWYTPPEEVVANEPLFLSQIMARGSLESVQWMLRNFPADALKGAYSRGVPGLFPRQAWSYWGLMLMGDPRALPYPVRFPDMPDDGAPAFPGF